VEKSLKKQLNLLFKNSIYKSALINNLLESQKTKTEGEDLFVDCNPKLFKFILQIIRLGCEPEEQINLSSLRTFFKNKTKLNPYLIDYIRNYFLEETIFIFETLSINAGYFPNTFSENVESYTFDTPSTSSNIKVYMAKDFKELESYKGKVAFFFDKNGEMIITFKTSVRANSILIAGFSGDLKNWHSCGKGTLIESSIDSKTWKNLGEVKDDWVGVKDRVNAISFSMRRIKYLRIFAKISRFAFTSINFNESIKN